MNVKHYLVLDDRTDDYIFEEDHVTITTDRGEVYKGTVKVITAFGIDIKQDDRDNLTVIPFKWIDHIRKEEMFD